MKKLHLLTIIFFFLCLLLKAEQRICIDSDWQFFLGDGSKALTDISVTSAWRHLDLPHDWSVETEAAQKAGGKVIGPFSTNSIGGYQTGFTVGGEGWYYKRLVLSEKDILNSHNELYFEGAYNETDVFVNGNHIKNNVYGYQSFRVETRENLHVGSNDILVRVRNFRKQYPMVCRQWYLSSCMVVALSHSLC